ncbi:hypothetical protein OSB04_028509 [Centaurea solstitialis]|uniref:F-box associated beta-propeller type 1 domain-containing protein n=1 Tax=Centaurea solstitialis TaxID=347529 RepID=A0AA38T0Q0_9ASTR|nr:hypothetical protein OSB04_028509 [Centaurea solstitialis]
MFTKMRLHHVNNQNHPKQLLIPSKGPCKYFRTIDCETPKVGLSVNRSIPFEANCDEMSIIASFHGLVCVAIDNLQPRIGWYKDIILWNPLTGEYKTLPTDNMHLNGFTTHATGFGLYYSCCDDDYKLLRVTVYKDAFIYSLKSDSWWKVESSSCRLLKSWNSSCFLNEDLYFLAAAVNKINDWSYSIIRFDTKVEKFTEIAAPSLEVVGKCRRSLTVVSGCVHLCVSSVGITSADKLELWKMDGDGEWTKVVSCCHTLFKYMDNQPLHLMKNGNWLVGSADERYAYEVDLEMKTRKRVRTKTPTDGPVRLLWGGKFVETIVSLNK